jgi:hypothetical protein
VSDVADRYSLASDTYYLGQAVFENPDKVRARRKRLILILLAYLIFITAGIFVFAAVFNWHFDQVWRYEAVGLLGATVGTAELLSRYRDAPSWVLLSFPGVIYILINVGAALLALCVIQAFDWDFGATGDAVAATQVLVAGLGAMALFRSSLLTVKVGDDDVGIGPSSVLSVLMAASDRAADRLRASDRAGRVTDIMENVSYEKAQDALPTVAVALMQNLSAADVTALDMKLQGLKSQQLPDGTKALLLGLKITDMVSTEVLAAAKKSLGDSILREDYTSPTPPAEEPTTAPATNGEPEIADRSELAAAASGPPGSRYASEDLPQTPQTPDPSD